MLRVVVLAAMVCTAVVAQSRFAWTFMSGSTEPYASTSTAGPGGRRQTTSWSSVDGTTLFLFGGLGVDATGARDVLLNDYWSYNVASGTWTQRGGSTSGNARATGDTYPGARRGAATWRLANGDVLLFGGGGYDSQQRGDLADLWRISSGSGAFSRVAGPTTVNSLPTSTWPGSRRSHHAFLSAPGCGGVAAEQVILFGGYGRGTGSSQVGDMNDVWVFNGDTLTWTMVAGSSTVEPIGSYGTRNVFSSTNNPMPRTDGAVWASTGCRMYLFGGWGFDSSRGEDGFYNDLWVFDVALRQWAWIGGQQGQNQRGLDGDMPASRYGASAWTSHSAQLLHLYGGYSFIYNPNAGYLSDHWSINATVFSTGSIPSQSGNNWSGVYCVQGQVDAAVVPGSRHRGTAWDASSSSGGDAFLFGGDGLGTSQLGFLNDVFRVRLYPLASAVPAQCTQRATQFPTLPPGNVTVSQGASSDAAVIAVAVVLSLVGALLIGVVVFLALRWRWSSNASGVVDASGGVAPPETPTSPASPSSPTPLNPSAAEMNELRRIRNSTEEQQDFD